MDIDIDMDMDKHSVADKVRALTPVPGGVGTVTATVLLKHTINSAMNRLANGN